MSYMLADETIAGAPFTVKGIQDTLANISWIELQNESAFSLAVQAGSYSFQIPAWYGWPVPVSGIDGFGLPIQVTPKTIVNYQATAPANTLSVIIYRLGEMPAQTAPYPLVRQTNIGNSVPVATSATQVINSGNAAPTVVLSGTPTGAGSPEAVINNDGSGVLGGGNISFDATGHLILSQLDPGPFNTTGGNVPFLVTAQDSNSGKGWSFYLFQDGSIVFLEWTTQHSALQLAPAGGIASLGGQVAAGAFGAPVIVAQFLNFSTPDTNSHVLLSFTPARGFYRINGLVSMAGAGTGVVTFTVTGPLLTTWPLDLAATTANGGNHYSANGATIPVDNYGVIAQTFSADGTHAVVVAYQNNSRAGDVVSAIIERLA